MGTNPTLGRKDQSGQGDTENSVQLTGGHNPLLPKAIFVEIYRKSSQSQRYCTPKGDFMSAPTEKRVKSGDSRASSA